MEISKLTTKYQATIPQEVRRFLGLGKGDVVRFQIENNRVVIEKAKPMDWQFAHFTENTLSEWDSPEDDEAFSNL
jgi:AbrB family looped-hinge helix DNA binding protein